MQQCGFLLESKINYRHYYRDVATKHLWKIWMYSPIACTASVVLAGNALSGYFLLAGVYFSRIGEFQATHFLPRTLHHWCCAFLIASWRCRVIPLSAAWSLMACLRGRPWISPSITKPSFFTLLMSKSFVGYEIPHHLPVSTDDPWQSLISFKVTKWWFPNLIIDCIIPS